MARRAAVLLAGIVGVCGVAALPTQGAERSQFYRHCGPPPHWGGSLLAHGVSCQKARGLFRRIRCADSECTDIHSGRWKCYRHNANRVTYVGNCKLGRQQIRWVVYE